MTLRDYTVVALLFTPVVFLFLLAGAVLIGGYF